MSQIETNLPQQEGVRRGLSDGRGGMPPSFARHGQYPGQNMVGYNQPPNPQQGQLVNGGWNLPNNPSMQNSGLGGIRQQRQQGEKVPRNNIVPGPNLDRNRFRNHPNPQNLEAIKGGLNPDRFSQPKVVPEQNGIQPENEGVQNPLKRIFDGLKNGIIAYKKEGGDTFFDHLQRMSPHKQGGANKLEKFLVSKLPINQNE